MGKKYWEKMGLSPPTKQNINVEGERSEKKERKERKEAYKRAHEIRQFETALFWTRGTYYWAFILAAFTAHFALLHILFSSCISSKGCRLHLECELCNLPKLYLFALLITAIVCYFFSLCWVLMNKGSKFWQENWEEHIYNLEKEFSGNLYQTILNTKKQGDFCACPLSLKAYNYSVTKVTMLTSIVLTVITCIMVLVYIVILFLSFAEKCRVDFSCWSICLCCSSLICIIALLVIIGVSWVACSKTMGNKKKAQQAGSKAKWLSLK